MGEGSGFPESSVPTAELLHAEQHGVPSASPELETELISHLAPETGSIRCSETGTVLISYLAVETEPI